MANGKELLQEAQYKCAENKCTEKWCTVCTMYSTQRRTHSLASSFYTMGRFFWAGGNLIILCTLTGDSDHYLAVRECRVQICLLTILFPVLSLHRDISLISRGPYTERTEAKAWERFHFPMERFYVIMELRRDQLSSSFISKGTDSSGKQFLDV